MSNSNPPNKDGTSLTDTRIRRLELELQSEKSKAQDARREAEILHAHIISHKPIRKQVKTLFRSIDESLKIRINELNIPKRKRASKLLPIDLHSLRDSSSEELLRYAKVNDLENFFLSHSGSYTKAYKHKVAKAAYTTVRKPAKVTYKVLKKIRRKVGKA